MQLHKEFIRLPLAFDAARLAEEIAQFADCDWRVLPLVDAVKGPMRATPDLARCPYIRDVLASLRAPIGRTRLMRIHERATLPADPGYYAAYRARVHVPVMAGPAATVVRGGVPVSMAAGEAWILDTSCPHEVSTPGVHLVVDTAGSDEFWEMVNRDAPPRPPVGGLELEERNFPVVMSPAEQHSLVALFESVPAVVRWFLHDWQELWQRYGVSPRGWPRYRELLDLFDASLEPLPERNALRELLVIPALNPELAPHAPEVLPRRRIDRPVFIVSSPRAGSTLLCETLWSSPTVFGLIGESHARIEGIEGLHPAQRGWESNRLTAADASPRVAAELERRFLADLYARDGSRVPPPRVRTLEKTTKSLLRIPFLHALYPDALFIVLHRDARETISSLLDVWRGQTMVTYPDLPGWEGLKWTLTLVPGWRGMNGKPLEEVVAHQWSEGMRIMLDDLESLDPSSWCVASYDALIAEPQKEIERLCAFADLAWDRPLTAPLPPSSSALSEPSPDKWRRNAEAIERIADRIQPVAERVLDVLTRHRGRGRSSR